MAKSLGEVNIEKSIGLNPKQQLFTFTKDGKLRTGSGELQANFSYDADGNLTKIEITEDNVKTTVTFTYDADGNLTKITKTIEVI